MTAEPLDLDAIRERVAAATEGPWVADGLEGNLYVPDGPVVAQVGMWREADAQFIAHARADVPALLAALDEARAALATARRDALTEAAEAIPGSNTADRVDPYDRAAEWLIERAAQEEGR